MAGTPTSTYRLQITPTFTLDDAVGVVPYVAGLGVSHLYLSPLLQAATGSDHGYDVVDHGRIDVSRGGEAGLRRLAAAARAHGLGVVLDIVPNHMSVAVPHENAAWWHLLMHGPDSPYARWFDVDWEAGPLLLPVLGSDEDVRDLTVEGDELRYYEHRFPCAPGTLGGTPQQVHERQAYRLVDWRRGTAELTYRRFFDVTDLAGIRVEHDEVFDASHALVVGLVREGVLAGLRIDHPDGLADPGGYLERLADQTGGAWTVVEKILEPGEVLHPDWRCAGTTGYDAARLVGGGLRRPGRRTGPDRAVDRRRRAGDVRGAGARGQDDGHPRRARRRGQPAAADGPPTSRPRRSRESSRGSRSTGPTCRRSAATTSRSRSTATPPNGSRSGSGTPATRCASGSSRPPAWSWPRASRTPRSTGTTCSTRSTRSGRTRPGSASASRSGTASAPGSRRTGPTR